MDEHDKQLISSILQRLDRLEAEVKQIRQMLSMRDAGAQQSVFPRPTVAMPVKDKRTKPLSKLSSKVSLESAIGTKWIGRVGMLAIICAVAFFLKYSFDNKLIGETGRIILGIIWGVGFIVSGEYFQKKKNWGLYGQILTGGGLAILYFSIYAAFAFYHLISQTLAFAALLIITTTGITLSIRYSALSIVIIGMLGGFLTPVMLSTGENRPFALFSYILMLDVGILSVALARQWSSVGAISLVCTVFIYSGWHDRFYSIDQQALAFGIATVFFLLFNIAALLSRPLLTKKYSSADQLIIFLSAAFYLLAFYSQNDYKNDWLLKFFVVALALVELVYAGINLKTDQGKKLVTLSFTGASVVLSVVAVFVVFEKQWAAAAIAAEMVVFSYIGVALRNEKLRFASYGLGAIAVWYFFYIIRPSLGPFERLPLLLNSRFLICAFIIAAFYVLMALLIKNKDSLGSRELPAIPCALVLTQFLSVFLISTELYDFYRLPLPDGSGASASSGYAPQLSLSIIWAVYASILVGAGIMKKVRLVRILGILLIAITVIKVFFFDLSELKTLYRIVSFVVLGLLLLMVSYGYNRFKQRIFGDDHD